MHVRRNSATFLGHSAALIDLGGLRVAFDVCSEDGTVSRPFHGLRLSEQTATSLRPLADGLSHPSPEELARLVDVVCFSHLHADHFNARYLARMLAASDKLAVLVPAGTRSLIESQNRDSVADALRAIVDRLDELEAGATREFTGPEGTVDLTALAVSHPAGQHYFTTRFERLSGVTCLGYRLCLSTNSSADRVVYVVGESAADSTLARHLSDESGPVTALLPVTDELAPTGLDWVEESVSHASQRTFATLSGLAPRGSILLPLHHGLWYFQFTDDGLRAALTHVAAQHRPGTPGIGVAMQPSARMFTLLVSALGRRAQMRKLERKASQNGADTARTWAIGDQVELVEQQTVPEDPDLRSASLEFDLGEYQSLREEVLNSWDWQKDVIIAEIGLFAAAIGAVEALDAPPFLYLVASFLLSAIGMMLVEQSIRMTMIGRYLRATLIPRIRAKLGQDAARGPVGGRVLGWEEYFRNGDIHTLLMGVCATLGKYLLAVAPGTLAVSAFVVASGGWRELATPEYVLAIAAFGLAAIPVTVGLASGRFAATGEVR